MGPPLSSSLRAARGSHCQRTDSFFRRAEVLVALLSLSDGPFEVPAYSASNTDNLRELGALGGIAKTAEIVVFLPFVIPRPPNSNHMAVLEFVTD